MLGFYKERENNTKGDTMIRVAICDDEKNICDQLQGYLERYAQEHNCPFEILVYQSADKLLMDYPHGIDLLLLDIYMAGVDGMAAARQIRTFDEEVFLIFITTMSQMAIEGYSVRAFGFVKKPVSYVQFSHELQCVLKQISRQKEKQHSITLKGGGNTYRIPVGDILCCEVRNHAILAYTAHEVYEGRGQIKELEEELFPYGFLRCHASYLVNSQNIRRIDQTELTLSDGKKIPISQRRRREFINNLAKYIGEQI